MTSRIFALGSVLLLMIAPASARTARCLLQVDGKVYIKGPCDFTATKDRFQISNNRRGKALYFAMVDTEPDGAEGFWNGTRGATHAHDHLGPMQREGACWVSKRAFVCAWDK